MAKQSKQPVVYVARELSAVNEYGDYYLFGYFVSKAYLRRKEIDYKESGDIEYNHIVDFNICPAIFAMDDNVNIHAENGDGEAKAKIFKDYKSCKEYVDKLNKHRLASMVSDKYAYSRIIIKERFKEVMKYAKYLEDKYIPLEEREQVSEIVGNK